MFIKVKEIEYNDEIIINTENISYIHEASNTILMNGTDGSKTGLVHLETESVIKILKYIEIV